MKKKLLLSVLAAGLVLPSASALAVTNIGALDNPQPTLVPRVSEPTTPTPLTEPDFVVTPAQPAPSVPGGVVFNNTTNTLDVKPVVPKAEEKEAITLPNDESVKLARVSKLNLKLEQLEASRKKDLEDKLNLEKELKDLKAKEESLNKPGVVNTKELDGIKKAIALKTRQVEILTKRIKMTQDEINAIEKELAELKVAAVKPAGKTTNKAANKAGMKKLPKTSAVK